MIDDLLTVRQLQTRIHVDRTTVYRMLEEGRLPGFKMGGQWRFSRQAIDSWLQEQQVTTASLAVMRADPRLDDTPGPEVLPINCLQPIQNVFAESLDLGAVTTTLAGLPLTQVSNCCTFCSLILATESGRLRCEACWRSLANQPEREPRLTLCHAGLTYARGRIEVKGEFVGMIFAGQFRGAGLNIADLNIQNLASRYGISAAELAAAGKALPLLTDAQSARVLRLLNVVAKTFSEMGQERLALLDRLRRISEMSSV